MTMINLTPHAIRFCDTDGNVIMTVYPSGTVARVSNQIVTVGEIDGIPVTQTTYGEVTDLPAETDGVIYIVSSLVALRVPDRLDVFVPSESVRDGAGVIIGCRSLGHV